MKLNLKEKSFTFFEITLRIFIGITFISAVLDRFGLWGKYNGVDVSWGSMNQFYKDVTTLTPWISDNSIYYISWFVTILELILGICMIIGFKIKYTSFLSGILFLIFAISMTMFLSFKLMLNYNVMICALSSFLLFKLEQYKNNI
ncbi:DUF417 family protein [Acinetobacter baumannii]|uniref:MauE/DoxX family redox-associated membrane protein n=1 Tax=Acinetobacter baumannii TaxID=470 RepID=UPI0024497769|nr:DUF417 family protein [Acinetobacter baumannii]MDH2566678.1 DUF417 family protein [Acinetobacter baumannii]